MRKRIAASMAITLILTFNFNSDYNSDTAIMNAYNKRVRTSASTHHSNRMQMDNTSRSFNFNSQQPTDQASGHLSTFTVVSSHDLELGAWTLGLLEINSFSDHEFNESIFKNFIWSFFLI